MGLGVSGRGARRARSRGVGADEVASAISWGILVFGGRGLRRGILFLPSRWGFRRVVGSLVGWVVETGMRLLVEDLGLLAGRFLLVSFHIVKAEIGMI